VTNLTEAKERLSKLADLCERDTFIGIASDLRLLLSRTDEAEAWRPIEEAPKDFSEVLVLYQGDVYLAVYEGRAKSPYWSIDVHDLSKERQEIKPTHFRPLPPPPKVSDDGR